MVKPISKSPRVFISYSLDSEEHRMRVLNLAQMLRQKGVSAEIDQYYEDIILEDPWPIWMLKQIKAADFVIVVCTEIYYRRCIGDETPSKGQGVRWESIIIFQELYDYKKNSRFITVGFAPRDINLVNIPEPLRGVHYYDVSQNNESGFKKLYRLLTKQPQVVPKKIGKVERLPPDTVQLLPTSSQSSPSLPYSKSIVFASAMPYHDLWIEIAEEGSLYRATLVGPALDAGQAGPVVYADPTPQQLTATLTDLCAQIDNNGPQEHISVRLYEALFTGEWTSYLDQLRTHCSRDHSGLRLHLSTQSEIIARLPWEYLMNPRREQELSRPPRWMLVRSPPGCTAEERALGSSDIAVRMLVIAPGATEEQEIIRRCLEEHDQRGTVHINTVSPVSWEALQITIRNISPQWLHITVPGDKEGFIIGQKRALITWNKLQTFLADLPDLRVVVLNVLDTSPNPPLPETAGSSAGLHADGKLWAVAATRIPASTATTCWYSHLLYAALAAGHSLTFAVGLGRFGIAHCGLTSIAQEWSFFMTEQTCDVIPFPPLTVPPRWAAKVQPKPEQVVALLHQVSEVQQELEPIHGLLENAHPLALSNFKGNPGLFEPVIKELIKLECPHGLTSRKNQALVEARTAQTGLRQCLEAIKQLGKPNLDPDTFAKQLTIAQNTGARAHEFGDKLIITIRRLLFSLWSEE